MNRYVFDTSALVSFIENESGADHIAELLELAIAHQVEIFVSVISLVELYYISVRSQNKEIAESRQNLIEQWPIVIEGIDGTYIRSAGHIKARSPMSIADCLIASLAMLKNAILVHKDPESEQIKNSIEQIALPYKR